MSTNEADPSTATTSDKAEPEQPQAAEQASLRDRIAHVGREKPAQLADQAKTKAGELADKARTAAQEEPKRGWAAVTAAMAAGAGLVVGWVIRRRRQARRSWWSRVRRVR